MRLVALALALLTGAASAQTLTATPSQCAIGISCQPRLAWDFTGICTAPVATAVPAGGGWTGTKAAAGSQLLTATTVSRQYTLTCTTQTGTGSATLTWVAPTQNTDGTPLTNLAGYRVYWGTSIGSYPNSATLMTPSALTYVVDNLTPATWYFAATAINAASVESAQSMAASKMIAGTPQTVVRTAAVTIGEVIPAPATDLTSAGTFVSSTLETRRYPIGAAIPITAPAVNGATRYEWEFEHVETGTKEAASTTQPSTTWSPPKAGHFLSRVRPCNSAGCAAWLSSNDRGYWFHAWIAAPIF